MKCKLLLALPIFLAACASNSGVVAIGQDQYFIAKQASTGLGGMGNLKGEALSEAAAYCSSRGKNLKVISERDATPPFVLGNFPRTELRFSCV